MLIDFFCGLAWFLLNIFKDISFLANKTEYKWFGESDE
jgi:hypothetical protein